MPIKYYFLNKPILCTKSVHDSDSDMYTKFGEVYSVREVVISNGIIVGFLLHEIIGSVDSEGETYFPKSSFSVVYKSLLSEADTAIRQLVQPLGVDAP